MACARAQEILKPLLLRRRKDTELVRLIFTSLPGFSLVVYVGGRTTARASEEAHRDRDA